ncbi:hypothetical protein Tco_0693023 [Tanacetum coccineum]
MYACLSCLLDDDFSVKVRSTLPYIVLHQRSLGINMNRDVIRLYMSIPSLRSYHFVVCKIATRPDVAFAQNMTSRFQQNPGNPHWTAVKNILKYLCNTKDMFLVYEGDIKRDLRVACYTDAGYLTDVDDTKS